MLKVSDAFNSAFAAPDRELRARVTIGKTVYDSDDLTSINYDSGAMTGEQFSIGSTYMNSTKITFSHLVEGLKQLDEVLVEFGVLKPDGAVEYVKMGTFIVDDKIQMDRNNNTTTIECMDRMTMLGGAYVSKLTYPARIKDVAVEIANMAGVKANETSFARLSENKINQPTGYTYRDAIGLIAQFQMGFALFDRDGLLDIRTLQDNSFKIDPNQYFLKGLVKNETFFKLNGISCTVVTTSKDENGNETSKTMVLQSGSSSGAQIKLANNVMTQDVLDRMYEALKFTNYYPFSLNWNGNPAVEAGDWLTVEDLQGNEFKVPNMSYMLTYNGGLTATSKADTSVSSPATYSYGGTISNIVNEIGGRESAEGNHIYEGTEDQEPTLSKEGDLWYKHVGPDTEEWIYKDGKWEFLTSTKTANDAVDAADKASKEAEEAKKTANKAVDGANDAVAKAGFATDTATQAKSDAAAAGQQAKDALTSAGTALTDAKKALTDSGSAMVDSAQARKDSATAIKDAADSLTSAKDALNKVGSLTTSVTSQFTTVNNELKSKVNQTDYDKLKGTVTSQQTEINQNASGINLKADKSYADTINNSVVKNTSGIGLLNNQIALTVSKTELTSKLNGYATQTWSQGQITATKNEITASVETVQTQVDNSAVGTNLLTGTSNVLTTVTNVTNWSTGISGYQPVEALKANQTYTASCYLEPAEHDVSICTRTANGIVFGTTIAAGSQGISTLTITPTPEDVEVINSFWTVFTRRQEDKSAISFKGFKLEKGSVATDWCPAPEDQATVDWTKSQLDITDKKITAGITTVTNTLNNTIANATAGMATTTWTNTQIDAAKTAINLSVEQSITTSENTLNNNIANATKGMATQTWTKGQLLVTNDKVSASVQKLHDTVSGEITTATTDMATKSWTQGKLDLTDSSLTSQISSVQDGLNTKYTSLEQTLKGVQITANNAVTQSQYTQLADSINLRVKAGDVINQINISPESILIAGQKVHITGQTSIDNAVIKDAMIANVTADKITAGTLNAANVNVINLNANNITTGTIKGANLSMNLNTGEVVFQHGRIHSTSNNIDVNIDQGYLSTASNNTRVMLKEGQLQLVQPTIFDNSEDPYLEISNLVGGASLNGANIIARDYLVLANRANSNALLDAPIDVPETFAGLAVGKISSGKWKPTRIGGAERGIIMRGGTAYKIDSSFMYKSSPEIFVGTDEAGLKPSDRIYINGSYVHIISAYKRTASGGPNVIVSEDGALVRSTSASKYKTDIIRTNIPDYGDKLLNLPTATWVDIAETKRFRDDPINQPKPTRNFGMIAEDLADAGLEMLVVRGADGELEGINYDRIGPALIPVIAKLKNEVETLKQQLEAETA